jgi:uncharacterized delta-60 repeat protein
MNLHRYNQRVRIVTSLFCTVLIISMAVGQAVSVLAAPGDLDSTFGLSSTGINVTDIGSFTADKAYALVVQDGGEIVVAGTSGNNLSLARYTSTGLLDTNFSGDGKQSVPIGALATAYAVTVQSDGSIVAAGTSNDGVKDHFMLVRFTSAGILDATFNSTGIVTTTLSTGNDVARAVATDGNGMILVAGSADNQFALLRYDTNGILDSTFGGGDGIVLTSVFGANDLGHSLALQTDGKILVAGQTDNGSSDDFALVRYDGTGNLDLTFGGGDGIVTTNFGTNTNEFALSVAVQGDDKIIAAGYTTNATQDFALARYLPSGDLDTGFGSIGKVVTDIAGDTDEGHVVGVQGNGKIVVAGFTFSPSTSYDFAILRYTTTGGLDTGFGGGGGIVTTDLGPILSGAPSSNTDDEAFSAAIQSDNKIVLAGFSDYPPSAGDNNFAIARYDSPNTPPVVSDESVTGLEDTLYTFSSANFTAAFSDPDGDALTSVKITQLPVSGELRLSGVPVTINQEIPRSNLGNLTFTPSTNFFGNASFRWNASDGLDYDVADAQMQVIVGSVNDAPAFTKGGDVSANEDSGLISFSGWATNIAAGPVNESGQVLTFTVTTNNDALFAVHPVVDSTSGDLSFSPAANANGSATATIYLADGGGTANGGVNQSAVQTFSITVTPVNDAPSFTSGADQVVDEDSGVKIVMGWATNLSPGPTDESSQVVLFHVTTSDDTMFLAGPVISPMGVLSFTPADDRNGSATISVSLSDNGGTLNSGVNTSAIQDFLITVNAVNDPPVFTKGANQIVLEDSGLQLINNWASAILSGPTDEAGQTLTFSLAASNPGLFTVQPALSSAGTLSYTPAADLSGSSVVTVTLQDNGGGTDTSAPQEFTIDIVSVNDAPSFTGGGNQTVNEDAGAQSVPHWATSISLGPVNETGQLLTFHTQVNDPGMFAVQPAVNALTGDLTYSPGADINGSATITVTLTDNGGTANSGDDTSVPFSLTITINPVNDAPAVSPFSKSGVINTYVPFSSAEFSANFDDVDGDSLTKIRIAWLPANGTLRLNGLAVVLGQEINLADISGLVFTPNPGWTGSTAFGWNGSDGTVYADVAAQVMITILQQASDYIYLPVMLHTP